MAKLWSRASTVFPPVTLTCLRLPNVECSVFLMLADFVFDFSNVRCKRDDMFTLRWQAT